MKKKSSLELHIVDLSNRTSINKFLNEFISKYTSLNLLINTALIIPPERIINNKYENLEMSFAVNILSYFRLMNGLRRCLSNGEGKIINVSGKEYGNLDINDLQYKKSDYLPINVYSRSMEAQIMLSIIAAQKFKHNNITVVSCHPGSLNMPNRLLKVTTLDKEDIENAEKAAETPLTLASTITIKDTGSFWIGLEKQTTEQLKDELKNHSQMNRLWGICQRLG